MGDPYDFEPPDWLEREQEVLAPYAMRTRDSRGRKHAESGHGYRTPYQRDRDRIVHSTAFRRLMYKTQVLVNQASDHHRTRLTHTLEVTQISRTVARQLGLNEDLTEAIALMHDLGHPPFGHSGEEALADCMKASGGFEHNRHGLRIVEELEYRYASFPGLNLTWEVLQAQAMHSRRKEDATLAAYFEEGQPLLEAQAVDAADSLAYNTHDVDDALSLGLITFEELDQVPFWRVAVERTRAKYAALGPLNFQPSIVREMIDWQVGDLLANTRHNLRNRKIGTVADVRKSEALLVSPGTVVTELKKELENFLHEHVYRHYRVMRMAYKGQKVLEGLFTEFRRHPDQLPPRYFKRLKSCPPERVICDYLAGMTDRYAQDEYLRLFQPYTPV